MQRKITSGGVLTLILLAFFAFAVLPSCGTTAQDGNTDYVYRLLDARLDEYHKQQGGGEPASGVTESWLELISETVDEPNPIYVKLLDYYLGSAPGTSLAELITEQGREMLPLLYAKRGTALSCEQKYLEICLESVHSRDKDIEYLIAAIERGKVLRGNESEDLQQ